MPSDSASGRSNVGGKPPTLATEKLRIATTGGYPPFTYVDNRRA